MNLPRAQQIVQTPLPKASRMGKCRAFDRMKAFARGFGLHILPTAGVSSRYGGLSWCDSTEQQLIAGIATHCRSMA